MFARTALAQHSPLPAVCRRTKHWKMHIEHHYSAQQSWTESNRGFRRRAAYFRCRCSCDDVLMFLAYFLGVFVQSNCMLLAAYSHWLCINAYTYALIYTYAQTARTLYRHIQSLSLSQSLYITHTHTNTHTHTQTHTHTHHAPHTHAHTHTLHRWQEEAEKSAAQLKHTKQLMFPPPLVLAGPTAVVYVLPSLSRALSPNSSPPQPHPPSSLFHCLSLPLSRVRIRVRAIALPPPQPSFSAFPSRLCFAGFLCHEIFVESVCMCSCVRGCVCVGSMSLTSV